MADTLTYKDAGVDIAAGDEVVRRIGAHVRRTHGPAVMAGVGGFASLFALNDAAPALRDPVLVSGTDGVGTKLKIAAATGRHDTIGIDLVAMCVNDVITTGATPLFFLDYFGTGVLEPAVAESVVASIAEGCVRARCALVGGETAELPGMYAAGEYDLAGFCVGVVERAGIVDGPKRVRAGDALIGIASHGLHSNGYSLVRKALLEVGGLELGAVPAGLDRPLADELLEPTAIYVDAVRALLAATDVHALAHITGGGLPENLPRVLPAGVVATVDRRTWRPPPIFGLVQQIANVPDADMARTFNLGLGMVAVVPPEAAAAAIAAVTAAGEAAFAIGQIDAAAGGAAARVELIG